MEGGGNEEWVYERVKERKYLAGTQWDVIFSLCVCMVRHWKDFSACHEWEWLLWFPVVWITFHFLHILQDPPDVHHAETGRLLPGSVRFAQSDWNVCVCKALLPDQTGPCDLTPLCLTSVLIELWENANHWHVGECWFLSLLPLQIIRANTSDIHGCLDTIYLPCFYIIRDLTSQHITHNQNC